MEGLLLVIGFLLGLWYAEAKHGKVLSKKVRKRLEAELFENVK